MLELARQGKTDINFRKTPELYSMRRYSSRDVKAQGNGENKSFIQYLGKDMAKDSAAKDLLRSEKAILAEDNSKCKKPLEHILFLPEMENNYELDIPEENLVLCQEIIGFILSSEKNDLLADGLTTKFYETIMGKLAEKGIPLDRISFKTDQFVNANQKGQLALMVEELLSDPKMMHEMKEWALEARGILQRKTSINTDSAKATFSLDKQPDVIFSSIRLSEDGKKTIKISSLQDNSDQIKNLIQFEQSRLAGKKAEKISKEELQADEVMPDKKNTLVSLEGNRIITDSKKLMFFVNQSSKQVPIDAKEVFDQIVKKAELMLKQGASEMKIELKPEFLGKMTIKILVDEGVVTAKFIAENLKVKQILESNLNTLRQSLESQGLRIEKAEVNVQLNNGGMFDGSENSRQFLWQKPGFSSAAIKDNAGEDNLITGMDSEENISVKEALYEKDFSDSTMNFLV